MTTQEKIIEAEPDEVFAVLSDGWSYAYWRLGISHVRQVDDEFPAEGSRIHHDLGPWPASWQEDTTAMCTQPPHRMELRTNLGLFGVVDSTFTLAAEGDGRTRVTMRKQPTAGFLHWLPAAASDLLMRGRDRETLRRLADVSEHRR
ncbi:SRPBCC family protein [Luedemannella flava]|uniref:SRPBCC family protein n=1 Tax=Luedemannella flava TaxID=349316 RepID=A0ABN2LZ85_9ACTN